mgnify:CR=1 FL=1
MIIKDWKKVVLLSMSFWANVIGLLVLIVPEVIFAYTGVDTDPVILWWVGTLLLVFGLIGRLFKQDKPPWVEWVRTTAVIIVIAMLALFASSTALADTREDKALNVAVPLISRWEGIRLNAYLDIVDVPTICYGSTRGIQLGMSKTKEECDRLLRCEVAEYRKGWLSYLNGKAYSQRLPATRDASYTSLAYNVGIRSAGRSTATRRLNSGDIRGGCVAIGWWNRAGGRVVRGLVNRRNAETALCLRGT